MSRLPASFRVFFLAFVAYAYSAQIWSHAVSLAPHYVYLAESLLHRHLDLIQLPPTTYDLLHFNGRWFVAGAPMPALIVLSLLVQAFFIIHVFRTGRPYWWAFIILSAGFSEKDEEGARLEKGAAILTLEVMKMEQTLRAPFAGILKAIKCKVGDIVQEGVELAEVEPIGE